MSITRTRHGWRAPGGSGRAGWESGVGASGAGWPERTSPRPKARLVRRSMWRVAMGTARPARRDRRRQEGQRLRHRRRPRPGARVHRRRRVDQGLGKARHREWRVPQPPPRPRREPRRGYLRHRSGAQRRLQVPTEASRARSVDWVRVTANSPADRTAWRSMRPAMPTRPTST